ncbi:MAG: hypothetical protein ABFD50_21150 [Smithella sp.]
MTYYILHLDKGIFRVRLTAEKVATYLLGKSIKYIVIMKNYPESIRDNSESDVVKRYVPSDGNVSKIQKELEAL